MLDKWFPLKIDTQIPRYLAAEMQRYLAAEMRRDAEPHKCSDAQGLLARGSGPGAEGSGLRVGDFSLGLKRATAKGAPTMKSLQSHLYVAFK